MKLVLAEKPSVAQSIAKVLGANKRSDGYLEGNGYLVSWCVGHLVELAQPEAYDEKYGKWVYNDLPIFPADWKYKVSSATKKQFAILKKLMARDDVASLVCATDAGREGELIFRLVYHQCRCKKPVERLWISSMEDSAIQEVDTLLEDSKIIELFFARVEQAIVELSAKYGTVCRRIARNILKNDLDAEECVNDTYLAAWNTIPPEKPDPLKTYIFRIVRNISIAKYHANTSIKRNSYYDVALEELESCLAASITVEQEIAANELSKQIDRFLATLDEESQMLFVRRYWYSDDISDLADRFHMNNNNVSVRLSRIRNKLKNYLQKEGYEI